MKEVLADVVPRAIHVVGNEDHRRGVAGGHEDRSRLVPVLPRSGFVCFPHTGSAAVGQQPETVPARPSRRSQARPTPHQGRATGGMWRRRHRDAPAVVHYLRTGQQLAEQIELLVGEQASTVDIKAEVFVFLGPITDSEIRPTPGRR